MALKRVMDKKIRIRQYANLKPTLKYNLFLRMSIFNFFLNHMVQKYQNEIAPIFYYGIITKTNEKDLKIHNLQALTLGRVKKITLYYNCYCIYFFKLIYFG